MAEKLNVAAIPRDESYSYENEPTLLIAGFNIWFPEIYERGIRAAHFGESDHAAIYEAQRHLTNAETPIIPASVMDHLNRKNVGLKNPDLVEQFYQTACENLDNLDNIDYAIKRILESAKKRQLFKGLGHVARDTHRANGNLPEVTAVSLGKLAEAAKIITDELSDDDQLLLLESPDDEGNAQAVNHLWAGQFLHCDALGWLFYTGQFWQRENVESILDRAIVGTLKRRRVLAVRAEDEKLVRAAKPSSANVRNCTYLFRSLVSASVNDFDNDPDLLNCTNGVVNLRTGEITPHYHTQRFTYCIGTAYDPAADDSAWAAWIYSTVTPAGCDDDGRYADLAAWVQMAMGYSLTGHTHEQCLFFLQGPPRGGKGVFLQTLTNLLGRPLSSGVDFDTFTQKRNADNQNFDLAGLKSCRLISASESERATMLNAKRVKSITGNDPVYCAHKNKPFFSYTPQYKIWLSSNFKVIAQADDNALWSRLRIINFPNSHLGREEFGLEARLWTGRMGILKWAIDGAIAWYQRKNENIGLGRPAIIMDAVKAHRLENDTVAQFIGDCCSINKAYYVVGAQLSVAYRSWCNENSLTPLGGRRLGEALRRMNFEYKAKFVADTTKKCWFGIGLEV